MAWWIYLIIVIALIVSSELLKKSKFGWVVKIGESAAYIAEQMGTSKNLSGEEKMNVAIETFRKLSKDLGVNWLTKWIPDEVIKQIIEGIVGKMNWNKKNKDKEVMTKEEFLEDLNKKNEEFLGTGRSITIDTKIK